MTEERQTWTSWMIWGWVNYQQICILEVNLSFHDHVIYTLIRLWLAPEASHDIRCYQTAHHVLRDRDVSCSSTTRRLLQLHGSVLMRRQRETWSGVIYEEGRVAAGRASPSVMHLWKWATWQIAGIDHILIHQTHSFSPFSSAVFVFSLHQAFVYFSRSVYCSCCLHLPPSLSYVIWQYRKHKVGICLINFHSVAKTTAVWVTDLKLGWQVTCGATNNTKCINITQASSELIWKSKRA